MSKKRPAAQLRIIQLPEVGPGARRYEVDCPANITGITWIPGPLALSAEMLITTAAYTHEERCGACDVSAVLDRGDQQLRAATERVWGALWTAGRRN